MNRLSENYYLRKCYLETNQVPTQSVMIKTMSPALAKVYFKSLKPKLKTLAGLEPPLKGAGNDWYAPPEDLLKGRTVLKPLKKEFLTKLGFNGLEHYGKTILECHLKNRVEETRQALLQNDIYWKNNIELSCKQQYTELSKQAAGKNTDKLKNAFHEFTLLYTKSLNKIETLLLNAAIEEIEREKEEVYFKMKNSYQKLLKQQATMLYDRYAEKLKSKKEELKDQFIQDVEQMRTELGNNIHDINLEKHVAIEKLRKLLECQNLACQIYVAMKEREARDKLLLETELEHKKIVKLLKEEVARNDLEIEIAKENERRQEKLKSVWQRKVCEVIKKFQEFIAYSLNSVPELADFLLNIEKLMLMQFSAAIENPSADSLFEPEKEEFHTPVPDLRPFYLFCDEGSKPQIDLNMCPKPCSSSSSQLPVIVVNKRCIYAACDNLVEFADKVEQFLNIQREKEQDLTDHHDYTYDVPIKYTPSQQLLEFKGQSSLMQILQKDKPNTYEEKVISESQTEIVCQCKLPHCLSQHTKTSTQEISDQKFEKRLLSSTISLQSNELSEENRLAHTREPKWERYFKFMEPKSCKCAKIAKKTLQEHLPPYMRKMSAFDYPDLPNYEKCSMTTLKKLVRKARGKKTLTIEPKLSESKTKDMATQYSDQEFEYLCTCFDDEQAISVLNKVLKDVEMLEKTDKDLYINLSPSQNYLHQPIESFVHDRALSLRNLLQDSPQLVELFSKQEC